MAGFTTVVLTSAASDVVVCSLTLIVNDVADSARSACYDISHSQLLQCLIIKSATRWRKNSIQDTGICDCLSMALDTQSNQFFSVCLCVCEQIGCRTITSTIDYHQILYEAHKCGRIDACCLWDKPEVVCLFWRCADSDFGSFQALVTILFNRSAPNPMLR